MTSVQQLPRQGEAQERLLQGEGRGGQMGCAHTQAGLPIGRAGRTMELVDGASTASFQLLFWANLGLG